MTAPSPDARPQRFRLSGKTPVLPVAVSAAGCLLAAILLLFWGLGDRGPFLLIVAVSVLGLGLVTTVGTFLFAALLRTVVLLDAESITVVHGRLRRRLRWLEVDAVTMKGPRVIIKPKPGARGTSFINPRSNGDPVFQDLVAAIQQRLDTSRGLRTF